MERFTSIIIAGPFIKHVEYDFPVAQTVKDLPVMQTWVLSLGWEVPLEKGMAIHSSILAWRIPWTEEPGELQSTDHKESDMTEQLTLTFSLS